MKLASYVAKGFFFLAVMWVLSVALLSVLPVNPSSHSGASPQTGDSLEILQRMDTALQEIRLLKMNNAEMRRIIEQGGSPAGASWSLPAEGNPSDPVFAYEDTRRHLELNLKEFWYHLRSKREHLEEVNFEEVKDIYTVLRGQLEKLREVDGYESYRERETKELARIVQSRIRSLQNPKNCDKAKKLICSLNKGCGFGCQIHHLTYCLIAAYASGRTLILESKGWRYNRAGWDKVFLPMSETCTAKDGESRGDWNGYNADAQVLSMPIVDFLKPRPDFLPVAIPTDVADRLEKVHGEPQIWWVGQFVSYILRPQPQTKAMIDEAKEKSGINSHPVVGIHVRRTDKIGTEASYHSLKEYMAHAEEYFAIKERSGKAVKRRVFIASDDPSVITEAKREYSSAEWEVLGDPGIAQSAALSQRYNGLNGIIRDVILLSECDYLVCTFSSQVCRLAYEILQTKHTDASQRFVSLDDIYYYGGGRGMEQVAILPHKPRSSNELELQVGDMIGVAGNHWNGLSKGTNRRTNKVGLYPSYKAKYKHYKARFPDHKWWSNSGEVRKRK